jgi:hypothetical protein
MAVEAISNLSSGLDVIEDSDYEQFGKMQSATRTDTQTSYLAAHGI